MACSHVIIRAAFILAVLTTKVCCSLWEVPKRKHDLGGECAQSEVVDSVAVLSAEVCIRVCFDVLVSKGKQHPSGRRKVPWVTSDVPALPFLLPTPGAHCKAKIEDSELLSVGILPPSTDEEVVSRSITVHRDTLQYSENGGHLFQEACGSPASAREAAARQSTTPQRALQQELDAHGLHCLLVHTIEPLVQRLALQFGHHKQHMVLACWSHTHWPNNTCRNYAVSHVLGNSHR
mmetsp:Transcript_129997/g.323952  ORF Transcript_129997/g.323952 Transcript_129997/m.323952 type:complete len:234 (+) Transcript_129997:1257-1958(+)